MEKTRENLNFTITQNKEIYDAIVASKTYEEFMSRCGNKKVKGYKDASFKDKRFKEVLTKLVADY